VPVLVVGNTSRREFRDARLAIETAGPMAEAADVDEACSILSRGDEVFDVIVVAAAHPGQFSDEAIERLRSLAPLARVVGLLGSWCEGELRSGHPWPGAIRVYSHQWPARFGREWARLHRGAGSSWGLPVTASAEERLLATAEAPARNREGLIAIHCAEYAMQDWLGAACRRAGYATVWLRPGGLGAVEKPLAGIYDGSDHPIEQFQSLRRFAGELHPAPVVVLLGFPRVEDLRQALEAGAAGVLSKPLQLEDLFWQLDQLTSPAAKDAPRRHGKHGAWPDSAPPL